VSVPRRTTAVARLARLGFADPARAERLLAEVPALADGGLDAGVIDAFAFAADPDLALTALTRIPGDGEMIAALRDDPGLRTRLFAVLGASAALGDHLARHPSHWRVLRDGEGLRPPEPGEVRADLLAAVGARPADAEPVARPDSAADPVVALRVAYRRRLLPLAARDLTGAAPLDQVASELADMAAAVLEAALAIARAALAADAAPCRLAVIAMASAAPGN
jgi:[glutamine synthetase] adenylyltransferase / [glutamine synthetase]-adenylyl-L-tyrosine phosphorylase